MVEFLIFHYLFEFGNFELDGIKYKTKGWADLTSPIS